MQRGLLPLEALDLQQPLPWNEHGVSVTLVRLDKLHPHRAGNKIFKLKYNLAQALHEKHDTVVTFGGAFSNHLRAAASACSELGLRLVCVVRGERSEPLNPVLQFVERLGGQLHFVTREDYREKDSPRFVETLRARFGPAYFIPDGGAKGRGVLGCTEIPLLLNERFDVIACACGTFTTMAGLILGAAETQRVIGVSVLKAKGYGERQVNALVEQTLHEFPRLSKPACMWEVADGYHFGGYAKRTTELDNFSNEMKTRWHVDVDFVYTAKLLYGIRDVIAHGAITVNSTCAVLMSGPGADLGDVVISNPPNSGSQL